MPTYSRNPKLFFVAASHLSIWDCYLTDEVMTYYPKKSTKQYFEIRSDVRCLTSVKDDKLILAVHVRSCLVRQQVKQSSGSVATVPSYLMKNEKEVREQARTTPKTCTDAKK